jgi:hypothetical protein
MKLKSETGLSGDEGERGELPAPNAEPDALEHGSKNRHSSEDPAAKKQPNLYCVMIPTHRNPTKSWFGFRWRRKFTRRYDDRLMKNVAILHGGYTLMPPSRGCWMHPPGHFQAEGMRPFLFTADTQEKANIIADLVAVHYNQLEVMVYVWGYDVQFRKKWEMIPFFTNMLLPQKRCKKLLQRLQRMLRSHRAGQRR